MHYHTTSLIHRKESEKERPTGRESRLLPQLAAPGGEEMSRHRLSVFNANTRDQKLGGIFWILEYGSTLY